MVPRSATGPEFLTCVKDPSGISTSLSFPPMIRSRRTNGRVLGLFARKKKPQWIFKNRSGNERKQKLSVERV